MLLPLLPLGSLLLNFAFGICSTARATNFAVGTNHAAAAYIRYFRSTIGRWLELIGGNEAFQNLGAI